MNRSSMRQSSSEVRGDAVHSRKVIWRAIRAMSHSKYSKLVASLEPDMVLVARGYRQATYIQFDS